MEIQNTIDYQKETLLKIEDGKYFTHRRGSSINYIYWEQYGKILRLTRFDSNGDQVMPYAEWDGTKWICYDANGILEYWGGIYWKSSARKSDINRQIALPYALPQPLYSLDTPCRFIIKAYPERGWHDGWISSITYYFYQKRGYQIGEIYYRCTMKGSGHQWIASETQL